MSNENTLKSIKLNLRVERTRDNEYSRKALRNRELTGSNIERHRNPHDQEAISHHCKAAIHPLARIRIASVISMSLGKGSSFDTKQDLVSWFLYLLGRYKRYLVLRFIHSLETRLCGTEMTRWRIKILNRTIINQNKTMKIDNSTIETWPLTISAGRQSNKHVSCITHPGQAPSLATSVLMARCRRVSPHPFNYLISLLSFCLSYVFSALMSKRSPADAAEILIAFKDKYDHWLGISFLYFKYFWYIYILWYE